MSNFAFNTYTGNGSTTQYAITWEYLDTTHVKAFLDGVSTTAFTVSSSTVTFNSAPANGVVIRIERQTPLTARLVDFQDGSVLTESDLDKSANQNFYAVQEFSDDATNYMQLDTDDKYNAQSKVIKSVANPVNNNDAVNKTYLENTWLSATDKATLQNVNSNITAINTVNSNISAITTTNSNATNINTVATNITSVNTVATDIAKVIAVANDLAEAVSEVETVADDLNEATSEIDTVANNIANVNAVGTDIANVNTVAGLSSTITAVNNNSSNINAVNSNSANINSVAGNSTNINTVAGLSSAITSVNNNSTNINTVANANANISTVAGANTNITTLAGISANITTVAGISSDVTTVAGMSSAINTVNSNSSNINTVAGANTNITSVAGALTNINSVATNLSSVNSFADRYRISANAPTTSLDVGDLWFDSTNNIMKVYSASGFQNAGSSVNGTSQRFKFVATSNQTTFSGNDASGNSLTYDPLYLDVYLNGIHLDPTDYTATNGTSIVLTSGASTGSILYVVSFGTFNVATINASNISSGTINDARLPTTMAGKTLTTATVEANSLTARGDGSSTDGKIILNCSQNSHGVSISSPNHASGQSYNLILPTSVGTNGQVLATNGNATNQLSWVDAQETKPTVANVSQTIAPATATTITITGTNFVSIPQVDFVNASTGAVTRANTVSFTSATSLSVNCTLATGNYYVRIENPDGNAGRSTNNIITSSTAPTFTTNAGSLGTFAGNFSGNIATITGSSDSSITFSEVGSNLTTANVTLSSGGVLATTDFGGSSTTATQYNFTLRITDAEGQTVDRAFSFTSSFGATGGGQFN